MPDASVCAYCFTAEEAGLLACPDCEASHHPDCWAENAGCAVTGCASSPGAVPHAGGDPSASSPTHPHQEAPPQQVDGWGRRPASTDAWGQASPQPAAGTTWGQQPASHPSWSVPAAPARPTVASAQAGWYPDPADPRRWRWFDGRQWTQWVSAPSA